VSASHEHELIVAMVARYIREQGYELVGLECSLSWLFGDGFRLPPSIVLHRPDILGVRRESPFLCIGEGKTRNDLHSERTRRQLKDFAEVKVGETETNCEFVVGIPADCAGLLRDILGTLQIAADRIRIIPVPRPLLAESGRTK
jgi:hypothetical protein